MGKVFCSFKWNDGTEGLIYYFDGDFYSVVGYRGTSIGVRIPSEYDDGVNGLHPVVRIIENSFEEFFNIVDSFYHLYYGPYCEEYKKGSVFWTPWLFIPNTVYCISGSIFGSSKRFDNDCMILCEAPNPANEWNENSFGTLFDFNKPLLLWDEDGFLHRHFVFWNFSSYERIGNFEFLKLRSGKKEEIDIPLDEHFFDNLKKYDDNTYEVFLLNYYGNSPFVRIPQFIDKQPVVSVFPGAFLNILNEDLFNPNVPFCGVRFFLPRTIRELAEESFTRYVFYEAKYENAMVSGQSGGIFTDSDSLLPGWNHQCLIKNHFYLNSSDFKRSEGFVFVSRKNSDSKDVFAHVLSFDPVGLSPKFPATIGGNDLRVIDSSCFFAAENKDKITSVSLPTETNHLSLLDDAFIDLVNLETVHFSGQLRTVLNNSAFYNGLLQSSATNFVFDDCSFIKKNK